MWENIMMNNKELGEYLKEQVKDNNPILLNTKEIVSLCTNNFRDKIVTCNKCGYEFSTKRRDDSRIKCKKCGSKESLSILSYKSDNKETEEEDHQ